jgi:hypothetical protein
MTTSKISTEVLPSDHQGDGEWLQITPGERFKIRTSVEETDVCLPTLRIGTPSRQSFLKRTTGSWPSAYTRRGRKRRVEPSKRASRTFGQCEMVASVTGDPVVAVLVPADADARLDHCVHRLCLADHAGCERPPGAHLLGKCAPRHLRGAFTLTTFRRLFAWSPSLIVCSVIMTSFRVVGFSFSRFLKRAQRLIPESVEPTAQRLDPPRVRRDQGRSDCRPYHADRWRQAQPVVDLSQRSIIKTKEALCLNAVSGCRGNLAHVNVNRCRPNARAQRRRVSEANKGTAAK